MMKRLTLLVIILSMSFIVLCRAAGEDNQVMQQLRQALSSQDSKQVSASLESSQTTQFAQNEQQQTLTDVATQNQSVIPQANQTTTQPGTAEQTQTQQTTSPNAQKPQATQQGGNNQQQTDAVSGVFIPEALREAAFRKLINRYMPLTPQQVIKLHKIFNESQEAAATWPGTPPKPVATSLVVNLAPGSSPPAIRLSTGFVSTVLFIDATGAPWPIERYDLGNPRAFDIKWDQKDNTLMIQPVSLYRYANLAVKLKGLNTPVVLSLIPENKVFDYRVDLRVPKLGPKAKALPVGDGLPATESPVLLSFLDGVAPSGSQILTVSGGAAQAWRFGDKIFLRTRMTVVSPSWLSTMSSADGMHAYEMMPTPMLLASRHGKLVRLKIGGL